VSAVLAGGDGSFDGGGEVSAKQRAVFIENVEWMAGAGEHLDRAAKRLGIAPATLHRRLQQLGRGDLAARLNGTAAAREAWLSGLPAGHEKGEAA
jgi:hypothetical protein